MALSLRTILAAIGAAFGLVTAGGVWRVIWAPEIAMRRWKLRTRQPGDIRLDAFRHAILAPGLQPGSGWIQVLARIGHGPESGSSPRMPTGADLAV